MIFATSHRLVTLHSQIAPRQKAFKQSLEKRPHWLTHVRRKAEHEVQFAVAFGFLSKSAHQPITYFVARIVLPLRCARESMCVTEQHNQRSKYVFRWASDGVRSAVLCRCVVLQRLL